jgi:hypothetical protein
MCGEIMDNKTTILSPLVLQENPMWSTASVGLGNDTQPDLLYMKSVLVSTGQNENDDVFLPSEMWSARATPVLKPVNWEHNSGYEIVDSENEGIKNVVADNQIIGVMFKSYPAFKDGTVIDESLVTASEFQIPNEFDIITEAAIYKYIFPKVTSKILNESAANKLYVSMEAWFTSFDYRVGNKVVARNENTAFLDGHLRSNGGQGIFAGEKVGRVLRNIVFGGVGIVANPANKDSVIHSFTNADYIDTELTDSVLSSNIISELNGNSTTQVCQEAIVIMSDTKNNESNSASAEAQLEDYKDVVRLLAERTEENKTQAEKLAIAQAEIESLKAGTDNVSASVASGLELVASELGDDVKANVAASAEPFATLAAVVGQTSAALTSTAAELAEANEKLGKLELDSKLASRAQQIRDSLSLDADSQERVEKLVASTTALDDESFGTWLDNTKELFVAAKFVPFGKKKDDDEEDMDKKKKDKKDAKASDDSEDGIVDTAVLDTAKATASVISGGNSQAGEAVTLEGRMSALAAVLLGNTDKKEA